MDEVRVAVIGAGNMGFAHAKNIFAGRVAGMRLTALCDILPQRRAHAAEAFPGLPVYESHTALLKACAADAVIIATPHYFHPQIAVDAFAAGCHVLTEKPAGVTVAQVRVMNEAAARSGRVFGIMFNQRTDPLFRRAREIVSSGQLGIPKRLGWTVTNWYRTQHYYDSGAWRATWRGEGGGVLLNQAPHNLDIWQWIFGMPSSVTAVCRTARYHSIEVEDEAAIYAEYENGASASFITTTGEFPGTNRLEIAGDLGKLVLEEGKLKWWRLAVSERRFCFESEKDFDRIPLTYEEFVPGEKGRGHIGILENFADAVQNGTPLTAPGYDGINELTISNAAYLSSWQERRITLPPDDTAFAAELDARVRESVRIGGASEDGTAAAAGHGDGEYSERWHVNW